MSTFPIQSHPSSLVGSTLSALIIHELAPERKYMCIQSFINSLHSNCMQCTSLSHTYTHTEKHSQTLHIIKPSPPPPTTHTVVPTHQLVLLVCSAMEECMSWVCGEELSSNAAESWCLLQEHYISWYQRQCPAFWTPKLWMAQDITYPPKSNTHQTQANYFTWSFLIQN